MGQAGEGMNISHQQKSSITGNRRFRDRFSLPVPDDRSRTCVQPEVRRGFARTELHVAAAHGPGRLSAETPANSSAAGNSRTFGFDSLLGRLPARGVKCHDDDGHRPFPEHSAQGQEGQPGTWFRSSPTNHEEPFGMEGLFRQIGIWNQEGQNASPKIMTS